MFTCWMRGLVTAFIPPHQPIPVPSHPLKTIGRFSAKLNHCSTSWAMLLSFCLFFCLPLCFSVWHWQFSAAWSAAITVCLFILHVHLFKEWPFISLFNLWKKPNNCSTGSWNRLWTCFVNPSVLSLRDSNLCLSCYPHMLYCALKTCMHKISHAVFENLLRLDCNIESKSLN